MLFRNPVHWLVAGVLLATLRVLAASGTFSATLDEPAHIAAGYDWWRGDYTTDPTHPPLARIVSALPLVLGGIPPSDHPDFVQRGNDLLYHGNRYQQHLREARAGNVLFLIAAIVLTVIWVARCWGLERGVIAGLLVSMLPPILGHTGVATTDIAVVGSLVGGLVALEYWVERPTLRRSCLVGLAIGLGVLSKFSFLPYFLFSAGVSLALRRPKRLGADGLIALLIAGFVVWGGYRFAVDTITRSDPTGRVVIQRLAPRPVEAALLWFSDRVILPAPAVIVGAGRVALHNRDGHLAFLFGECTRHGWWYYFPVAILLKTPIALLLLCIAGILFCARDFWYRRSGTDIAFALHATVLLAFACTTAINIGIRHILPLYIPICALAANGIYQALKETRRSLFGRSCLILLVAWFVGESAVSHPDYLSHFNQLGSSRPDQLLVDSNLDWGQDILRLAEFVHAKSLPTIGVHVASSADLSRHGISAVGLDPYIPRPGWAAVSATALRLTQCEAPGAYAWLRRYRPVARAGRSIEIYYVPP